MILLANTAATFFLLGLIWFVQLVHYPVFSLAGPETFGAFHRKHTRRTTWVVALPMIVEMVTALWLVAQPQGLSRNEAILGAALVAMLWFTTRGLQIPQHEQLARRFDHAVVDALVQGNWIRTALWTARAALCAVGILRLVTIRPL